QAFPLLHQVLILLGKAALIAQQLKLDSDDLAVLQDTSIWPNFNALPVMVVVPPTPTPFTITALTRLMDYAALRDGLRAGRDPVVAVIAAARASGATPPAVAGEIAARLGRTSDEVTTLAGLMGLNLVNDMRTEFGLKRLAGGFTMLDRLGIAAV